MKIPLQEKIAELESRICGLEERERLIAGKYSQQTANAKSVVRGFGPHWHKMWEEFHLMMKEMFE